jgi:hypothetical protein
MLVEANVGKVCNHNEECTVHLESLKLTDLLKVKGKGKG